MHEGIEPSPPRSQIGRLIARIGTVLAVPKAVSAAAARTKRYPYGLWWCVVGSRWSQIVATAAHLPARIYSSRVVAQIVPTLEQKTPARAPPFLFGHVRSGIPVLQASPKWGGLAVLALRRGRRSLSNARNMLSGSVVERAGESIILVNQTLDRLTVFSDIGVQAGADDGKWFDVTSIPRTA